MISNDYSFMARLVSDSSTLRDQLDATNEQVASGRVSDTYSGLGNQARTSLSLTPTIAHQTAWSQNIDAAQGRLDVTQTAMTSISGVASKFFASINTFNANDSGSIQSLAQQAKAALQQVGDLLNTKSGDIYVFGGQDSSNPPVPDTDPTVMSTGLSGTGPAPFSSSIGTKVPTIQVGAGQSVQVGLLANANTLVAPTTGSYMRDTLTALAKLAGLGTSSNATADVTSARNYLSSSISAMATETGTLGNIQSTLTQRQTDLSSISTALTKQLSAAEDVDSAAAITKASTLKTQLQASYQIIADTRSLSLANYL